MTTYEVSETATLGVPIERVWEVVNATNRYGDWVHGVVEVTDHHGAATVGETYAEINRTLGPLTTNTTWTVREIETHRTRVDTGTGLAPLRDFTNVFDFRPTPDGEGTEMTYTARYRVGLGPLGMLVERLVRPGMRKGFQASMRNLEDLITAEG